MDRARECLDEIVELYQSGPSVNGPDLLSRVVDLYFVTSEQQSLQDREVFGDVMERMAYASEPDTRAMLAERMSTADAAPIVLIRRLAQDEIFIARPVLQYSPSLREGDLISLSKKAEQDHLKATSHRKHLTIPVTDIIVKRGDLDALMAVVGNTSAEFSPSGLTQLFKAASLNEDLQQMLNLRRDMAPRAITKLKRLTEVHFWQQMAESILMTSDELDKGAPAKPVAAPVVAADKKKKPEPKEEPASKPKKTEPIKAVNPASEAEIADSARGGKVVETIEIFTKVTQLDKAMVEHCLFQAHISALMVLCKAHAFAPGTFTALLQLRETISGEPTDDTIGLMRRYENMTADTAKRIISFSDKRPQAVKAKSA